MKRRIHLGVIAALGLAFAGAAAASEVRSEAAVRALLDDQGYTSVTGLMLDDGMWLAEARDEKGNPVTIKVDPGTARVFATSRKVTIVHKPAPVREVEVVREIEVPVVTEVVKEVPVEVVREVAVVPAAPLTAEGARAVLIGAGYHNVHDLSLRRGVWKAEARDASGDDREVHVDAMSGAIVHVEDD